MSPFVGIIFTKALIFMSTQISYKDNKNRIKKKLSFFEIPRNPEGASGTKEGVVTEAEPLLHRPIS